MDKSLMNWRYFCNSLQKGAMSTLSTSYERAPLWGHIRTSSHESNASFLVLGWISTAFLMPGVHKADLSLISGANYRDCEILSHGSLTDRPNDAEFPMGDRDHTSSDVTARRHATNGPPPSALLLARPRSVRGRVTRILRRPFHPSERRQLHGIRAHHVITRCAPPGSYPYWIKLWC